MPHTKIWIHFVWSTKNRVPLMMEPVRTTLFSHIQDNAKSKHIHLDSIGGYVEHVHALVGLKSSQSPAFIMQHLKGESSHWINRQRMLVGDFEWQDEYFAISVSDSSVENVRNYIANQVEHHRTKTFQEEYDLLFRKYKF